jgi:hypothetical protein
MRLALKGNPTILLLLFTPDDQLVHCDGLGRELSGLAPQRERAPKHARRSRQYITYRRRILRISSNRRTGTSDVAPD